MTGFGGCDPEFRVNGVGLCVAIDAIFDLLEPDDGSSLGLWSELGVNFTGKTTLVDNVLCSDKALFWGNS